MDNVSAQEIDRIVAEMGKTTGALKNYATEIDKAKAQAKLDSDLATKKFKNSVGAAGEALGALTGSYRNAVSYLATALGGGLFAKALTGLASKGSELTKVYQDLAAHGNTFGGSLLNMQMAAAQAGLPLEEFAEATKRSSQVIAQMGRKEWPQFQMQMRKAMVLQGNYAMSVSALTEFTATYLETYRRTGAASSLTAGVASKNMVELANVTSNLSEVSGKARDEIATLATSAINSSMAISRIATLPASMRVQATHQMEMVTSILAAQAGAAGEFMTSAFAETVGTGGLSEFTSQGKTLINAGLGNLAMKMNNLSKNPGIENTVATVNDFKDELQKNLPVLNDLALSTGESGSAAREMLKVYTDLQKMSASDIRKQATKQDGITKFFNTIETIWNQITSGFQMGFLKGFQPFFKSVGDITNSKTMERFAALMAQFGEKMGVAVAAFLTEDNLKKVGSGLSILADGLVSVPWGSLFTGIVAGATFLGKAFGGLMSVVSGLKNVMGGWKHLLFAVAAGFIALKALKLASLIRGAFGGMGKSMTVNAASVVVNGGGMGGGGDSGIDLPDGGSGGKKKGSTFSRRMNIAKKRGGMSTMKAVGHSGLEMMKDLMKGSKSLAKGAAKGLTKGLSMAALHSGLKKIPIIGALAGIGFAVQRATSGDIVGAGLELASGAAGTIPGVGTAASLGIDAAIMGRDMLTPDPSTATARPASTGKMAKGAAVVGAVGATAAGAYGLSQAMSPDDPSTDDADPFADTSGDASKEMIKLLKSLLQAQKDSSDLMMVASQSDSQDIKEMIKLLNGIYRKS